MLKLPSTRNLVLKVPFDKTHFVVKFFRGPNSRKRVLVESYFLGKKFGEFASPRCYCYSETFRFIIMEFINGSNLVVKRKKEVDELVDMIEEIDIRIENNKLLKMLRREKNTIQMSTNAINQLSKNAATFSSFFKLCNMLDSKEMRLIHGDISCNNIIVTKDKKFFLLDFESVRWGFQEENFVNIIPDIRMDAVRKYYIKKMFGEHGENFIVLSILFILRQLYYYSLGIRKYKKIQLLKCLKDLKDFLTGIMEIDWTEIFNFLLTKINKKMNF